MNQMQPPPETTEEEKPLDPAVERVRAKMVRLLAVSMGIMFVSIFAVLAAVIYRINAGDADALIRADIGVPAGFTLIESGVSGDRVHLHGTTASGETLILVYHADTGALLRALTLREGVAVPNVE
ncbi:MAG: hypothetical protein AAF940_01045 [Pseudomonadota bacterium]